MWKYNYTNELYHHGVKGMKWGVIRDKLKEGGSSATKTANKIDTSKPKKVRLDLNNMSDEDLRKKVNRELLERQYNDLFAPPTKAEKGKAAAKTALAVAGGVMTAGATAISIALMIKQLKGD